MEKITLRPIREADREQMYTMLTDGRIKKFYMLPDFENQEQVEKLFQRFIQLSNQDNRFVRGMDLDGRLVGFLNDVGTDNGKIELGYVVHPHFWGRGYCTAGLKQATEQLFAKGFREVVCGAFESNQASIRVMEKAGMEKLDFTESIEYRGKIQKCVYYGKRKVT
jgi:RimJ/RimL family protein N-acetyltransferase